MQGIVDVEAEITKKKVQITATAKQADKLEKDCIKTQKDLDRANTDLEAKQQEQQVHICQQPPVSARSQYMYTSPQCACAIYAIATLHLHPFWSNLSCRNLHLLFKQRPLQMYCPDIAVCRTHGLGRTLALGPSAKRPGSCTQAGPSKPCHRRQHQMSKQAVHRKAVQRYTVMDVTTPAWRR